jgi:predicted small lipoprotein YifL
MHCWARYLLLAVVAALGTGQMLAACGQKGALFLPRPESNAAAPKAAATPKPAPAVQPQPQGAGEGLDVLDEVQSTTPDLSGM